MSRELRVGGFVLASALIFLGTFLYVANVQLRGVRIPYKTYFKYAGGVDTGSPVRFGGMKAGAITAVHPWREDPTKIEVLWNSGKASPSTRIPPRRSPPSAPWAISIWK
jgi:ABC-type transporter Mla subunit MlaD